MSLRVLSESLSKVPVQEKQYIVTTAREINEKMLAAYNKMKSIREQVESIQSQWKSLQEDLEGVTFARYITNGTMREQFLKAVDDLKLEYDDAKSTYLHYKELKNKLLLESEDSESVEDQPQVIDIEDNKIEVNSDAQVVDEDETLDEITRLVDSGDKEDLLDYMFNEFVPEYGPAKTFVGELVRALMHILFIYKLSGHTFYQDQGISECGGAAQFLMDNGYEDVLQNVMVNDSVDYNKQMFSIVDAIARDIITDTSILTKTNSVDSKTYDNSRIIASAPSFNYTLYIPYRLIERIESDDIQYSTVVDHARLKLGLDKTVVSEDPYNDKTAIEFTGLTKTQFDTIDNIINNKDIWDELYSVKNTKDTERNIEVDDILSIEDETVVNESVEATNIVLTEDTDSDVTKFLELHNDAENYKNNTYGFEKLYQLFDSYGFSEDEDVSVCFKNLSEEDKALALQLIRRKD